MVNITVKVMHDDDLSGLEAQRLRPRRRVASNPEHASGAVIREHASGAVILGDHPDDSEPDFGAPPRIARMTSFDRYLPTALRRHSFKPPLPKLRESIHDINAKRPVFMVGLLGGVLCFVAGYVNAVCIVLYTGGATHATGLMSKTAIAAVEHEVC
jgi:hypothetical protein